MIGWTGISTNRPNPAAEGRGVGVASRGLVWSAGGLKSDSFSLVIGVDEDYASPFQSCPDHCSTSPMRFMLAVLESAHCAATDASTFGEFFLSPAEKRASGMTLFRAQHAQEVGLGNKKIKITHID